MTPIYPPPYHPADSGTITLQDVLDAWDVVDRLDAELIITTLLYAHGMDLDDVHSALMALYRAQQHEVPWWSQRVAELQRDLDAALEECANLRDELAAVRLARAAREPSEKIGELAGEEWTDAELVEWLTVRKGATGTLMGAQHWSGPGELISRRNDGMWVVTINGKLTTATEAARRLGAVKPAPAAPAIPIPDHFTDEDRRLWQRLVERFGEPKYARGGCRFVQWGDGMDAPMADRHDMRAHRRWTQANLPDWHPAPTIERATFGAPTPAAADSVPIPAHFTVEDREVWRRLTELHGEPSHDSGCVYANATWLHPDGNWRADLRVSTLPQWFRQGYGWCTAADALSRIG